LLILDQAIFSAYSQPKQDLIFVFSVIKLIEALLADNEENANETRALRFYSPTFAYDYKTGNYFPKFYQENVTYLLSTFADLTGGLRTAA